MLKGSLAFLLAVAAVLPANAGVAPAWPTLAEQLQADAVLPGSALEGLIAANQDFSLLREDEAKDNLRIPLWLRVLWRKAHPEGVYAADDPTGGYPRALQDAHLWLMTHPDLVPGPAEKDTEPGAASRAAAVSGEQRISGLQPVPRSQSDIRVNYWDPMKILSASNNIVASGAQAQYFSIDGGTSWGQTTLTLQPGDAFHSEPAVDWTSDGTAWTTTLGIDAGITVLQLRTYKSLDAGANWTFDSTASGAQTNADTPALWVDHSDTSPFKDNLYAIWHNGSPAFMSRRPGPAGSWQTPIQVSGAETAGTAIGGDVKTNAFGDVFGFWPSTTNRKIFAVKSTNGGVSYGTPVQIAGTIDGFDIGVPSFNGRRALIYVSGGAYRTATKDLVYATWTDLTGAAGCTSAVNEPGANVASTCKTRIWFARSTNGGNTWSTPVMLNNQASLNDQYNQRLVVDETTGALAVVYYDTVGDAGRKKTDLWYQSSFNDGATWQPAVKITSAQTDETVAGADLNNQYGDRNGLSGTAGIFFPSWTDRRNNAREEIWTAKVTDPACTPPGAPAIGAAAATGPNQIQVTWGNGAPPATSFNVYRALGTCASPGSLALVAGPLAGSPYTDNTVSGGSTYAYFVTGLDASGQCESALSGCTQATATGACILPPAFAGLASAVNQAAAGCRVTLSWPAATPACGGPVAYNVYRSTSSGFTPGAGNQIASGVTGTSYVDNTATLASGTRHFYVVRAVDTANGMTESNTVERGATPTGPFTTGTLTETFEGAGGFDNPGWTHSALTGGVDWVWSTAQSQTPTHSWFSDSQSSVSDRVLVSPSFALLASSTLSFRHTFDFETDESGEQCFDAGTLEISVNGGASWSVVPDAAFTAGGFNDTVDPGFNNPLANLRAWCGGTIGPMSQVTANLGSLAGPTDVRLRWHAGDDSSSEATGWFVDSVILANVGIPGTCSNTLIFTDGFETGNTSAWGLTTP